MQCHPSEPCLPAVTQSYTVSGARFAPTVLLRESYREGTKDALK
jgi:hypothetical protein